MQLRHRIEYYFTAGMLALCRRLPKPVVFGIFRTLGGLMYYLLRARTRLTLRNIGIVFPEKTAKERRQLARRAYRSLSESMAFNTLMTSGRFSNEELLDMVEVEGWENYEEAVRNTDMGLCVFSAHIGNWELLPQYAALKLGGKMNVITRETSNPLLEEKIVKPLRVRFGVSVFYKKKALMRIIKVVKKGEHAGLLIDQKLKSSEGIRLNFFGRMAPTTPAPALLQVRFGVSVLPAFMIKAPNGKHRLIIRKAVSWTDNGQAMEDQIMELTRIHQKIVEEIILEYPDQWFWMHNRWNFKKGEH